MEAFFIYLLKSSGVVTIFLLCYYIFLRKETFFNQNRIFLMVGLIASFVVPLLTFTKTIWIDPIHIPIYDNENVIDGQVDIEKSIDWFSCLFYTYLTGTVLFFARLVIQLLSLRKLIKKGNSNKKDGLHYVEIDSDSAPFSFFHYIVYNPTHYSDIELDAILTHEKIHAKAWHSLDILAIHLMTLFQWCNPFIWLYKSYVAQNLEFIADTNSLKKNKDKVGYQYLMLKTSTGENNFSIANPFFNSLIKKRIVMINTSKSNQKHVWKYSLILPLLFVFTLMFNIKTEAKIKPITEQKVFSNSGNQAVDEKIYRISKEMSDDDLAALTDKIEKEGGKLTIKTIKRNKEAHIISIVITYKLLKGFVTGSYSKEDKINSILFGQNKKGGLFISNSEEALMKEEIYVDKIALKHAKVTNNIANSDSSNTKRELVEVIESTPNSNSFRLNLDDNNPLFIIDGKETSKKIFENFDVNKIRSMSVLKEEVLVKKYGDKGKHGVIIITTKNNLDIANSNLDPLYIVDGNEVSKEEKDNLNQDTIESMNVYKGEKAIAKYGAKGKNGVIEIILKKNKEHQKIKTEAHFNDKEPLFILDGKEISKEKMDKLDQGSFASVNILKGEKAIAKYGAKGKEGVVEIITKK